MTVLIIAVVALAAALLVQTILDPWTSSPSGQENAAEERAREMQAIAMSCF